MTLVLLTLDFIFQVLGKQACAIMPSCVDDSCIPLLHFLKRKEKWIEEGNWQASHVYQLAMVYQVKVRLGTFSPTKSGGGRRILKAGNRVRDNPCFQSGTF